MNRFPQVPFKGPASNQNIDIVDTFSYLGESLGQSAVISMLNPMGCNQLKFPIVSFSLS